MELIALTLGLFGSLHCLGMCGPLAIMCCGRDQGFSGKLVLSSLMYNFGRTISYIILGLIFGLLGGLFMVAGAQKLSSIVIGLVLLLSFFFSLNLNGSYFKSINKLYQNIQIKFINLFKRIDTYPRIALGMVNGILPCGLVYVALAGAIAAGSPLKGALFMLFFGLGTIPMLFTLILSFNSLNYKFKNKLNRVIPFINLIFGGFLIYRGIMIDISPELDFWLAIKEPIMCH